MLLLSATSLAIRSASERGTLRFVEQASRFGGTFIAICDEQGVIEVASDMTEAKARVAGK